MRKVISMIAVAIGFSVLVPITATPASAKCRVPGAGSITIFSRVGSNVDGVGNVGNPTVNSGAAGCAPLVWTATDRNIWEFDTRLIYPGATQISVRYSGGQAPTTINISGLGFGGVYPLGRTPATVPGDPDLMQTPWMTIPSGPAVSGRISASTAGAHTTYDTVSSYECSEARVNLQHPDAPEVIVNGGEPCGNV